MTEALHLIETPALLTIYEVAQQAQQWQTQLQLNTPISWSLEALSEFDAAGLQLLIAMANAIQAKSAATATQIAIVPPLNSDIAGWLLPRLCTQQGV